MDANRTCVGIVSAGAMGSALGRAWREGGARVVTTVTGRSPRTTERATAAGLELLADLAAVVTAADVLVSIAPPDQAEPIADAVARAATAAGCTTVYADLNAIAPPRVERIAARVAAAGLRMIDGAISGGPPRPGGSTTLYLSGQEVGLLAAIPADGLDVRVVGEQTGRASAVKMCTASVYKGFDALLIQAMLTAGEHGVEDIVAEDLAARFPDLVADLPRELAFAATKAWRYVPEMREIEATQSAAGARPELFDAMAQVWAMVCESALAARSPEQALATSSLDEVLDALTRRAD